MPLHLIKQTEGARVSAKASYNGYDIEIVTGWFFQRDAWQAFANVSKNGHVKKFLSADFWDTCDIAISKMADEVQEAIDTAKV